MKALTSEDALRIAHERANRRRELIEEMQATLRGWNELAAGLAPFDHGTFISQLRYEVNSLAIELGDELQGSRRFRKKLGQARKHRIIKRDNYTCQICGIRRGSSQLRVFWLDGSDELVLVEPSDSEDPRERLVALAHQLNARGRGEWAYWSTVRGPNPTRSGAAQIARALVLTVDHVLPESEGGASVDENLQTLCGECNNRKGKTLPELPAA